MTHLDTSRRFMIENSAIRGEWTLLDTVFKSIVTHHNYPLEVQSLLGQMVAAAVMLSSTIKFEGMLIMQAHGNGPVSLATVECSHDKTVRALARWQGELEGLDFKHLLADAQMTITIVPDQGERYQGIVSLQGNTLAECLEFYFQQSEQIKTRIWLAEGNHRAAGLLLQVLPFSSEVNSDPETLAEDWQRVTLLADTLTHEEHLSIDPERLLFRLFHEEQVRLFDEATVHFACRCSRERVAEALALLPKEDMEHILADKGTISTQCEYCNQVYEFDEIDVQALFNQQIAPSAPGTH